MSERFGMNKLRKVLDILGATHDMGHSEGSCTDAEYALARRWLDSVETSAGLGALHLRKPLTADPETKPMSG